MVDKDKRAARKLKKQQGLTKYTEAKRKAIQAHNAAAAIDPQLLAPYPDELPLNIGTDDLGWRALPADATPAQRAFAEANWHFVSPDRPCRCSGPCRHGQPCEASWHQTAELEEDDDEFANAGHIVHIYRIAGPDTDDVTVWQDNYECSNERCSQRYEPVLVTLPELPWGLHITTSKPGEPDLRAFPATGHPRVPELIHDRQPYARWVLTDEIRAWFSGEGWRGIAYPNLYDWLDQQVQPDYDCDWCGEPGSARETDSSISLTIAAYDPDLSPATMHLATKKYHAACKPSSIVWARKVDIPAGPQRIGLPSSAKPEVVGEFEVDVRPVVATDGDEESAVLLLTARVVQDHGDGPGPWLNELRWHLNGAGFGHPDSLLAEEGTTWSLRVVADYPSTLAPQWIAIRTEPAEDGRVNHLLLSALSLPAEWVEIARRDQQVEVIIGPCTAHWDAPEVHFHPVGGVLEERMAGDEDRPAGCWCSEWTAADLFELADEGSFITGPVQVLTEEG